MVLSLLATDMTESPEITTAKIQTSGATVSANCMHPVGDPAPSSPWQTDATGK